MQSLCKFYVVCNTEYGIRLESLSLIYADILLFGFWYLFHLTEETNFPYVGETIRYILFYV